MDNLTYIKIVIEDMYKEYEVWFDGICIGIYQTIQQANKKLGEML